VTERYDAIVIGGGAAGGTAAILLAQAGWSVALVEKRVFPRRKVCGECIAAPNLALLDALDVGAEFAAIAGPELTRVGLYVGEETLCADLPRLESAGAGWARALGREQLDTLLLRRAARLGVTIRQPCAVKHIERRGSLYTCRLDAYSQDAESIEAPVLIAAHGSWETQPWDERAARRAQPSDLVAFKANFSGANLEPGLLPVLAFRGGYGGMVVADGGMLTLACCIRRDALREWRAAARAPTAGEAVQAGLGASCRGVRLALAGARREGAWLSVAPVRPGIRAPWSEQSGFAVGNAAGEAHPILGEGISMAMQSAWLLCRRLVRERDAVLGGESQSAIAREYRRDWRRHFTTRLRLAAVLAHLAMRPEQARPLLPLLRWRPGLLTAAARLGGKATALGDLTTALTAKIGHERARARTMVAATVPRLGDKEA
jgi:2-polyprenyl-6-methoxyphenol hydroxylase-like FAD-dependent oxidoreductase